MRYLFFLLLTLALGSISFAQKLVGNVLQVSESGDTVAVSMAALQWHRTSVGTHTAPDGTFSIERTKTDTLIVSFPTFTPDTVIVPRDKDKITITLNNAHSLREVSIVANDGSYISVQPILTQVISTEGLRRAACCNLAESFEGTISIDADYPDAISGAKQISMLGLAGIYSQILVENVPFIRILSQQFGLGFVPGSWMESINISKGAASVVNGYEGITGQVDVEYKKPETNLERVFLNVYGNTMGRGEVSFNTRIPIGEDEKASTNFLVYAADQFAKMDMNHDGFMDAPRSRQINFVNRWDYKSSSIEGRTLVNFLWDNRFGGQTEFTPRKGFAAIDSLPYGFVADNMRLQIFSKNGFLLKGENESIGTIVSFTGHNLNSRYGSKTYAAKQNSAYLNLMYSNKFGATNKHKLTAGTSFQYDFLDEIYQHFANNGLNKQIAARNIDFVPGIFAEYAYIIDPKFVFMVGMRTDYNTRFQKLLWTPRVHAKWQATNNLSFRTSVGKGYRVAQFFPENLSMLVSSREIFVDDPSAIEEAYNCGFSTVWQFNLPGGRSSLSVDYFYTHFIQQMIIDLDNPLELHYYALNGNFNGFGNRSRSHSAQIELTLKPFKRFEILLAYRYNDVRHAKNGVMKQKELMSPHKALINLNYSTPYDKWKFNINCQIFGPMPLPNTDSNPKLYQRPDRSEPYCLINAQITKKFRRWEIYFGAENILNVKQKDAIIASDKPFSDYFDATMVYAPITGIMGYAGFRFILK